MAETDKDSAALAQFLNTLVLHCLNQNDMMWNRTQLLVAVQGAVIAAGYYLYSQHSMLAMGALGGGAFLTLILTLLAIEDRQDRNANLALMDAASGQLIKAFGWEDTYKFRITNRPRWLILFDGDRVLIFVFLGFVMLDLFLAGAWFRG